ncbi:type II secretion system F family protein [Actinoallomurus iriomotensis]|uniref:Type II secretion system protein GspF domain-containing protein n=1 Tax=Actinoallomurus iriomotensis TaxID=478107 RepID=A0A9W6S603_9ACTN|nr:hypothetical protein [Actinoallomurus iriomotensis]GLY86020.1 hypothetical protein Airi02_039490 [Actinoallomurus iriomotensis]
MELLAALAGLAAAGGLLLAVAGLTHPASSPGVRPPGRLRPALRSLADPTRRRRLSAAAVAGLVVLLVAGWPVAALAVAAGVYVLPPMLSGREPTRRITRLEALEQWARRLGEVMGASRGLEATLTDSLHVTPTPIRAPVAMLAERLNNRASTEHALRAFAEDLDDPIGDLIATALILAAKRRGPGTRQALGALADAVAAEVIVRREVEAERASLRTTLLVIVIAVAGLSLLLTASPTLSAPYGTPFGQMVLAAVAVLYAGGLAWMKRLSVIHSGPRFLHPATREREEGNP